MTAFGTVFTDEMIISWNDGNGWGAPEFVPSDSLNLHPAAHVLHYSSTCFEGLKAFDGAVRGTKIIVHIDHLNLLYKGDPSQRMIRWRMLIEEYHPTFVHVKGKNNDAVDALSRLTN